MRSAAFILVACLLFVDVNGRVISPRGRCLCTDAGVNYIARANIEKIKVLFKSSSCQNLEIIVTLKNGGEQKCLNPKSHFSKNIIRNAEKENRSKE